MLVLVDCLVSLSSTKSDLSINKIHLVAGGVAVFEQGGHKPTVNANWCWWWPEYHIFLLSHISHDKCGRRGSDHGVLINPVFNGSWTISKEFL